MLTSALRAAVRPTAARAFRPAARPVVARAALSTSAARWSAAAPLIQGEGAKPGEVPTDEEHATGLARLQLLGDLAGEPAFDYAALDSSRVGTPQDPIKVYSLVSKLRLFARSFVANSCA
jgi:cytochrome c oxidase subunit 5b